MDIKGPLRSTGKIEAKGTVRLDSPREDRRIDLNGTLADIDDEDVFKAEFKTAVATHLSIEEERVEVTKLDDMVGAGSRRRLTSLEDEGEAKIRVHFKIQEIGRHTSELQSP